MPNTKTFFIIFSTFYATNSHSTKCLLSCSALSIYVSKQPCEVSTEMISIYK